MALDFSYIAAPMVNQSDSPFRILARKHGATMAYTQMLLPQKLLDDQGYLEFHKRDLETRRCGLEAPVIVQLCGNDAEIVVAAGRKLQNSCDGIDLNLGCPQEAARDGHYGAYLLGQIDWPLVEGIVSAMSHSFTVPVSTKIRLCQPSSKTLEFAERLQACGSSWITLHARTVSARRRRQGAADLSEVKRLVESDTIRVPIVSNGNVRVFDDLTRNREFTGAAGLMVGETLLGNPCIFENQIPDPVNISLEYLELCRLYPGTATLPTIQTHVRHFIDFQCSRRPWFNKFRAGLNTCSTIDEIDHLVRVKVERWRGRCPRPHDEKTTCSQSESDSDCSGIGDVARDKDDDPEVILDDMDLRLVS